MNRFAELCTGRYYVIPHNQRGYSWDPQNAADIFEDLNLAGTHAHYMGPVIVTRTNSADFQDDELNTTVEFTLEDGQQRLTTFFLIANEIRKRLEEIHGAPDIESTELERLLFYQKDGRQLRLQNRNQSLQQYFSYLLIGIPAPPADRTPPMVALDRVQAYVSAFLANLQLPELIAWKRRITNQAKFIWVDLASESVDPYLTFDAINSRGLPLSEFDKIKNFCILVTTKRGIAVRPEEQWYLAITELENFGVATRHEEAAFITDLYAAFYDERVGQGDVHASFVRRYRRLLTQGDQHLENELRDFVELWQPTARSFGFVASDNRKKHYGVLCTHEAGTWLTRLDNMDLPTITRIILTTSHLRFTPDEFQWVVRACEIYTFRMYAVLRYRKDTNAGAITSLAHSILRAGGTVGHVMETVCNWLQRYAPMDAVVQSLSNGDAKYGYDRRIRGWAHCYYFLYEYELWYSPAGVGPWTWESSHEGRYNTQEHILPNEHRDGGWWEAHWPNEAEADRFKHRLGNLVLTPNNSALGRKSIDLKLTHPGAPHYYTHANATNSEKRIANFTNGTEWRPANILRREYEMLLFATERWSIPCCADNGVIALPAEFGELDSACAQIALDKSDCIGAAFCDSGEDEGPPQI